MQTTDFMPDETTLAALGELADDEPVVMLNLLEFIDDGQSYARYGRTALPQIVKRGGKILYSGLPLFDDSTAGHWDRVILVYYPTRASFLDMMADPDYRVGLPHRTAGLKRTVLYAFTQNQNVENPLEVVTTQGSDKIFMFNLLRFNPDGGREDYEKYSEVVMPMLHERGAERELYLDAQLPLVSDNTWEEIYLVRYPTTDVLQEIVATEAWQAANKDRERGLDLTWAFPTRP